MKLIAGLLSCAVADVYVTSCNHGGDAANMAMKIDAADVQIDLVGNGWALTGDTSTGYWTKNIAPASDTTNEATDANGKRVLRFVHSLDSSGCESAEVDGVTVCTKIGHVMTFTCDYDLDDQNLTSENPFTVSGSDTVDSASNTGTLSYTLSVGTTTAFTIGSEVTATITPATSGLVVATIKNCEVKNKDSTMTTDNEVSLIDAGLNAICDLGSSITTGQGTGVLGFKWNSFKWSTAQDAEGNASDNEAQEVKCSISLAKTASGPSSQANTCS